MSSLIGASLPLDVRLAAVSRRSRRNDEWRIAISREITKEDLILLHGISREMPDAKAPLGNIREPHHMMAKLLAKGTDEIHVSAITGYSLQRIRTLKIDPAFRELVSFYETEEVFHNADVEAQIRHVSLTAGSILCERLEDDPESFSNKELQAMFTAGVDRLGHGPSSKVNVNVNNPAAIISALRDELLMESQNSVISRQTIDVSYREVSSDEAQTRERFDMGEGDS